MMRRYSNGIFYAICVLFMVVLGDQLADISAHAQTAPVLTQTPMSAHPTAAAASSQTFPSSPTLTLPEQRISIIDMLRKADPVVQGTMIFLLLCSAASWAALIEKSLTLALVARHVRRYAAAIRNAATMDGAEAALKEVGDGPARRMWLAAHEEWTRSLAVTGTNLAGDQITRLLQRLVLAMGSSQERSLSQLGNWMGLLATIGATAPFIGLFGTVWGILDSFEHIAVAGNTSLAAVAPGIAEALLATAAGLFAAIPATMFYNRFARRIGQITGMLDNVTAELIAFASRDAERLGR